MSRNDRDRPDDPRTREQETQRLERDEYDRPQYGSPAGDFGPWVDTAGDSNAPSRSAVPDAPQMRNPAEVRVHEFMTRRVTSVHPATSVERAARLMDECDCGALPVIGDDGVLVGMITDRDIVLRIVACGRDARHAIVADCMTERVFACFASESLTELMHQMAQHQVRRMPIVDDRRRLVGIVAQSDLARHAVNHPLPEERQILTETVCALSQPADVPYR